MAYLHDSTQHNCKCAACVAGIYLRTWKRQEWLALRLAREEQSVKIVNDVLNVLWVHVLWVQVLSPAQHGLALVPDDAVARVSVEGIQQNDTKRHTHLALNLHLACVGLKREYLCRLRLNLLDTA